MAGPLAVGIIGLVFLSVMLNQREKGPGLSVPAAPPGLLPLRLILVTTGTAMVILMVAWLFHRSQKRQRAATKPVR